MDPHKSSHPIIPPQNTDAEASLLGAILIDSDAIVKIADIVSADDFYDQKNAKIYEAIIQLYEKHNPIDVLTLSDQLKSNGYIDFVGGAGYVTQLTNFVPTAAHVEQYAEIVAEKAMRRKLIQVSQDVIELGYNPEKQLQELIESAESKLFEVSQKHIKQDITSIETVLAESFDRLDELHKDKGKLRGIPTGFKDLDNILAGLQRSDLFILAARPSMGKAQPLTSKVLTSSGWKQMGQLKVGDQLASVDGKQSIIKGIFPQGKKKTYTIKFSDGRETISTADHLWRVNYRSWDKPKILTTKKLMEMLTRVRYKNRLWIDSFNGHYGLNTRLPIKPWVLGMLLGDGDLNAARFSSASEFIVNKMKIELGKNYSINSAGKYDYRITVAINNKIGGLKGSTVNPVRDSLRDLKLWGLKSESKFVPEIYLNSNRDQRIELIQGLLDADGWVEKHGSVLFSSASKKLADNIVYLIRSIGGWAKISEVNKKYTYKGKVKEGQVCYKVLIHYANPSELFSLPDKIKRTIKYKRIKRPVLTEIKEHDVVETQCIAVSHPSQCYITDSFIVTHNTAFSLALAHSIALKAQEPVLVFSLEMSKEQLVDRMLANESGVDAWALRTGNLTDSDFEKIGHAMGALSEAQIFIDDTPGITVSDLRTKARREAHIRPLGLIIVDYLQLMSGGSRFAGDGNRVQEISAISRGLKGIARELNVPLIALSQLSRSVESRTPQIPQLQDLRESGSIEQDADVVAFLYREDYYNPESERKNIMDIFIKKHRNGPTGAVELYFDKEKQRFRSVDTRHTDPFS